MTAAILCLCYICVIYKCITYHIILNHSTDIHCSTASRAYLQSRDTFGTVIDFCESCKTFTEQAPLPFICWTISKDIARTVYSLPSQISAPTATTIVLRNDVTLATSIAAVKLESCAQSVSFANHSDISQDCTSELKVEGLIRVGYNIQHHVIICNIIGCQSSPVLRSLIHKSNVHISFLISHLSTCCYMAISYLSTYQRLGTPNPTCCNGPVYSGAD